MNKPRRRATPQQDAALQLVLQALKKVKRLPGIKPPQRKAPGRSRAK